MSPVCSHLWGPRRPLPVPGLSAVCKGWEGGAQREQAGTPSPPGASAGGAGERGPEAEAEPGRMRRVGRTSGCGVWPGAKAQRWGRT